MLHGAPTIIVLEKYQYNSESNLDKFILVGKLSVFNKIVLY